MMARMHEYRFRITSSHMQLFFRSNNWTLISWHHWGLATANRGISEEYLPGGKRSMKCCTLIRPSLLNLLNSDPIFTFPKSVDQGATRLKTTLNFLSGCFPRIRPARIDNASSMGSQAGKSTTLAMSSSAYLSQINSKVSSWRLDGSIDLRKLSNMGPGFLDVPSHTICKLVQLATVIPWESIGFTQ